MPAAFCRLPFIEARIPGLFVLTEADSEGAGALSTLVSAEALLSDVVALGDSAIFATIGAFLGCSDGGSFRGSSGFCPLLPEDAFSFCEGVDAEVPLDLASLGVACFPAFIELKA